MILFTLLQAFVLFLSLWEIPSPYFAALHLFLLSRGLLTAESRQRSMFPGRELLRRLKERFRTALSLLSKAESLLELCKQGWQQEDGA